MYLKITFYVPPENRLKTLGFLSHYEFRGRVICQRDVDVRVNMTHTYRMFEIIIQGTKEDVENFLKVFARAKLAPAYRPNHKYLLFYEVMEKVRIPH